MEITRTKEISGHLVLKTVRTGINRKKMKMAWSKRTMTMKSTSSEIMVKGINT